jgi:hypothetical protein
MSEPICQCGHPLCIHAHTRECGMMGCDCKCFRVVKQPDRKEAVDHPQHYGGKDNPYEHIKVCDAWGLNYRLGSATKYICRAGKKSPDAIEDLRKAVWFIQSEIERLESEQFGL